MKHFDQCCKYQMMCSLYGRQHNQLCVYLKYIMSMSYYIFVYEKTLHPILHALYIAYSIHTQCVLYVSYYSLNAP